MFQPKSNLCPFLKAECAGTACRLWTHLRGMNPQTGQEIDQHGCSIEFLPVLLIENSQQQRSTAAAVESFRNEMITGNERFAQLLLMHADPKLIEAA